MLSTFEIKSYKQLELVLGFLNVVYAVALIVGFFFLALTPQDRSAIETFLTSASTQRIWALVPLAGVGILWAWFATQILRLHDRVHEPVIRKWRAAYDADFILRTLMLRFKASPPAALLEKAYSDRRLRRKLMQRLFYDFIGDETKTVEGKRLFFYGEMARYWAMALASVYSFVALFTFALYAAKVDSALSPVAILVISAVLLFSEVYSNRALDSAHDISVDQIASVQRNHESEWMKAFEGVVAEEGYGRSEATSSPSPGIIGAGGSKATESNAPSGLGGGATAKSLHKGQPADR